MPTVFTHSFFAAALGKVFFPRERLPARFWVLAAVCAALPDADVLAFFAGVRYGDLFGHRGFTHSLVFALLLASAVVFVFFRESPRKKLLVLFFFLATASHGLLYALTNGGLGVAFFAPFSGARYFFPFRPVEVSPLSVSRFLGADGAEVIASELLWVWLPVSLAAGAAVLIKRR
ncbi:MAG TPA: metal-dependent hydrolase [Pyrinomonadaceae bacterium]|jgi:inner membrane protein|nr:metal-dependent hydrolase [Pyrinomonadaceae bacterium]